MTKQFKYSKYSKFNTDVKTRRKLAAEYEPEYLKVLNNIFKSKGKNVVIAKVTDSMDMKYNTDYTVYIDNEMHSLSVKLKTKLDYTKSFTIRLSGRESELDKIKKGFGRYCVVTYTNSDDKICYWELYDLNVFRSYINDPTKPDLLIEKENNYDHSKFKIANADSYNNPPILIETGTI